MLFKKSKEVTKDDLFEQEYNYFISLGGSKTLSEEQCEYLYNLDYDTFNKLTKKLCEDNIELFKLVCRYYLDNVCNPGVEKNHIKEMKFADDFIKDSIELMLNAVDESRQKDLILEIGKIYTSSSNDIHLFKEKMISLLGIIFYEISTFENLDLGNDSKKVRNIINKCVDEKLQKSSFEEIMQMKRLILIFVNKFKNDIVDSHDKELIDLSDYLNYLLESDYKDVDEVKHNVIEYRSRTNVIYDNKVVRVRANK